MEEEISTTNPTDSEEILILTHRIAHEIANQYEVPLQILNKFLSTIFILLSSFLLFK